MNLRRPGQRSFLQRLVWIVTVTILMGAVLPSLSQAHASRQAGGFAEICSATGTAMVVLDAQGRWMDGADTGHGKPSTDSSSMNCPCCALHHGALPLPPAGLSWAPPTTLRHAVPRLFLQSPRPLFAWAGVRARAPPSAA